MGTRTHQIEFVGDEREAVATDVRDGIGEELSGEQADEIVDAVGALVARNIQQHDDAEVVVVGVKDLIVEHLIQGGHADAVVMETADVVLEHLPFGSLFIRRALKKIVKGLLGRSDEVVAGVGDIIGEKLVQGGHAGDLVREVAELVVETATEGDYTEAFVEETLDEGLAIIVEEDGVVRIVERVEEEYPAEAVA